MNKKISDNKLIGNRQFAIVEQSLPWGIVFPMQIFGADKNVTKDIISSCLGRMHAPG